MVMLHTVNRRLFFGKPALGPQVKERMVLAVLPIAGGDQAVVKITCHGGAVQ
jgi:hypothetical protein